MIKKIIIMSKYLFSMTISANKIGLQAMSNNEKMNNDVLAESLFAINYWFPGGGKVFLD